MRQGLYVIYDRAANDVSQIYQAKTVLVAERNFLRAIKDTGMEDDYELWRIGFLDTEEKQAKDGEPKKPVKTKLTDLFEVVSLGSDVASEKNRDMMRLLDPTDTEKTAG